MDTPEIDYIHKFHDTVRKFSGPVEAIYLELIRKESDTHPQ